MAKTPQDSFRSRLWNTCRVLLTVAFVLIGLPVLFLAAVAILALVLVPEKRAENLREIQQLFDVDFLWQQMQAALDRPETLQIGILIGGALLVAFFIVWIINRSDRFIKKFDDLVDEWRTTRPASTAEWLKTRGDLVSHRLPKLLGYLRSMRNQLGSRIQKLSDANYQEIVAAWAEAIGPAAAPEIAEMLCSWHPAVQHAGIAAAQRLGRGAGPLVPHLVRFLETSDDQAVRQQSHSVLQSLQNLVSPEFAATITAALTAEKERVAKEERARLELQRARQAVVDARQSMCQHRWVVSTWHESTDTGESCTSKYCPVCGKHA